MSRPTRAKRAQAPASDAIADQLAGAQVAAVNLARQAAEAAAIAGQEKCFGEAMAQTQIVRLFVNDTDHILGSHQTKHGEIAEVVEVGVRRAHDALMGKDFSADVHPNRISPIDYTISGDAVQSKFINGSSNGLTHVLDHLDKYKEFGRDGESYYHIPKDQHEQIRQVLSGTTGELNPKTVEAIQAKVLEIETETGKPFDEVVRPSTSTYAEVQQGKVNETLDSHEDALDEKNESLKDEIRVEHEPSLQEGLQTAAMAGAIGGAFSFAASAGKKYFSEGKNIFRGDFTKEDWKEVGLDTGKATLVGAVTGGSVYFLTNYVGASAPLASAFVSTTKGLALLATKYQAGELAEGEFTDQALLLSTDVAMVALASAAGQALIPIPILGAMIGSFAGKMACEALKDMSASAAEAVMQRVRRVQQEMEAAHLAKLREMEALFLPTMTMQRYAFDIENNRALLQSSLTLGRMLGVPESKLLKSADEALAFLKNHQPAAC